MNGIDIDNLVKMSEGISKLNRNEREGIVLKSLNPINDEIISFKGI